MVKHKTNKVHTQIRLLLLLEQSDQGLHCLQFPLHLLDKFSHENTFLLAHLSRRLIGELIVYQWSGVRRPSVRPSSVRPSSTMLKDLLLRNCWADQSQILCGASLGRGNYILFVASGSHDQDGRHAHIW